MLLFMHIHLFYENARLSQSSPDHMRQYRLIHQHPPQPNALHCSGLNDGCGANEHNIEQNLLLSRQAAPSLPWVRGYPHP